MEKFWDVVNKVLNFAIGSFTISNILSAVIVLAIGLAVSKRVMKIVSRMLDRSKLDKTLASFVKAVIQAIVYFIIVVIVAECLPISPVSLVAVFSVAGLAVSLAAENSLSNLAGGVLLLILKPFEVGDYIDAAGTSGTVQGLGLIYTEILTADNKHVFVPNKDISAANITNYSSEDKRRVDLKFETAYDAETATVKAAIMEAINSVEGTLSDPEPFVKISNYKESTIEYTVRVWCKNEDYWDVYFNVIEAVRPAFDKANIEFTYNHLNVHILEK